MAWTLVVTPNGEIFNKYFKNNLIFNVGSVQNIESSHFVSDYFSSNLNTNNVDIKFQLSLFDDNPINTEAIPNILGITQISISNDVDFQQVLVITPNTFNGYYNNQTNYVIDCSVFNIPQLSLPSTQTIKFSESSGSGTVTIKNWPLSDGSGLKRVFLKITVELTNGNIVSYPLGYGAFDEINVFSTEISTPSTPQL